MRNFSLFIFTLLAGVTLRVLFPLIPDGSDSEILFSFSFLMLGMLIYSIFIPRSPFGVKTILRPDTGFIVFYYILFAHPYLSYSIGFSDINRNKFISEVFLHHANRSIIASTVGLVFFMIGYYSFENYKNRRHYFDRTTDFIATAMARRIFLSGFLLTLTLFFLTGAWTQLITQYTGLATGDATSDGIYFLITFFSMALVCSTMSVIYYRNGIGWIDYCCIASAVLWALVLLITGDRNSFLLIVLILPIYYATFVRRVGLQTWLILGVAAFVVYQAVEVSRSSGNRDFGSFIESLISSDSSASDGDALSESSFSLTTVTSRAAFEDNKNGDSLYYGKFKIIGIMGVIPYSRGVFFDASTEKMTSAEHITEVVLGRWGTWSLGSNVISDIVVDLGVIFIPLVMFLIGAIGGVSYSKLAGDKSMAAITLYLFLTTSFFEYPRYTVDFLVRGLVWLVLIIWISKVIAKKKRVLMPL